MRRGRGSLALALGVAACLGACFVGTKDTPFDIEEGILPFQLNARVENQGDGFGKVTIGYFEVVNDLPLTVGVTVPFPCTAVLGPGASCLQVVEFRRSLGVQLEAEAEPNSKFQGWSSGDCTNLDPEVVECLIDPVPVGAGLSLTQYILRIAFDLRVGEIVFTPTGGTVTAGGDLVLSAAAYTDPARTLPVQAAEFTWASSNPSVATVTPSNPGSSVTVSGVALGQAWIRATARATTDSVLVVVQ